MRLFGYPYNDLVICKDSPDYLDITMISKHIRQRILLINEPEPSAIDVINQLEEEDIIWLVHLAANKSSVNEHTAYLVFNPPSKIQGGLRSPQPPLFGAPDSNR